VTGSERIANKLAEAAFFLEHMRAADETTNLAAVDFGYYFSAFQSAAGSIRFIIQDGLGDRKGVTTGPDWWKGQVAALTTDEQALINYFTVERNHEVHRGASNEAGKEEVRPAMHVAMRGPNPGPIHQYMFDAEATVGVLAHKLTYDNKDEGAVSLCSMYLQILPKITAKYAGP
jgi:hypothetical protein